MTKHRLGVSLVFLINGIVMGSWAPQIPELFARLSLTESQLGLLILVFGIGSLVLMPIAGMLTARHGSRIVALVLAACLIPTLLFIAISSTALFTVIFVFLLGAFTGGMDVAMNANAVAVEKSMRRAIMSSCHAFWSLGGLIGAGFAGLLIQYFGAVTHAALVTVVCAIALIVVWPLVLRDAPAQTEAKAPLKLPLTPLPWLIGIMALFSMVPEGAIMDWGALYLRNELGASVAASGLAFGAFSLTMAAMRFAGDLVRERFGAVRTLQVCALISITGLLVSGVAPNSTIAIFGFALAGIGISNMVPIAFSAAGNMPGLAPGVGMSVVTTMGYSGILVAPSLIGFIAQHTGLAIIFVALPILHVVVLLLSRLAKHADHASNH
jgi:fucose permease